MFNGEKCTIIHRDIKPSNIIIIQDPTVGELAKILDFGIAKLIQSGGSQTQSFMGTLAYCSPEQMEGKELDHRSDIYSLGVMMYEMLTTEMPLMPQNSSFGGWYQAHHEFKPEAFDASLNIPKKLKKLVMRCLKKEKEQRPQTVREILQVLEGLKQTSHQFAAPQSPKLAVDLYQPKQQVHTSSSSVPEVTAATQITEAKALTDTNNTPPDEPVRDVPIEAVPAKIITHFTEICFQKPWPKDKPIKKIVFADILTTNTGSAAVICVMLDEQDILKHMLCRRYNQFLFIKNPHPVLLWLTLLYHPQQEPRWLPCYLDLKTSKGQKISRTLAELGSYRLLFFSLEQPEKCKYVMGSTIDPQNRGMLLQWANTSHINKSAGSPQSAKDMLKRELETLKPKILLKMEASC